MIPIHILITDGSLFANSELAEQVAKLEKQGHTVTIDESLKRYDFIAGPNCWLLRPEICGLFQLAVTNARRIANADQDRAKQSAAKKTPARKPKRTSSVNPRSRHSTTKGSPVDPVEPSLPGQLSLPSRSSEGDKP